MSTCNRLDLQTLGPQPVMPRNLPRHWGGGGVSFLSSVSFIPHGNDSLLHVIFEDKIGSLRHCLLVVLQRVYCIFGSYIYDPMSTEGGRI